MKILDTTHMNTKIVAYYSFDISNPEEKSFYEAVVDSEGLMILFEHARRKVGDGTKLAMKPTMEEALSKEELLDELEENW